MRDQGYWIIYPEYFDARRSKGDGRRVPRSLAVEAPSLEELAKACKLLGLEYIIEKDKRYPKNWYESQGRVLVKRVDGLRKKQLLRELAKTLQMLRKGEVRI
jgi:signal recognition particle subunit SRP19